MPIRNEHIMVCVTGQRNCERLIRHSAQLAQTLSQGRKCQVSVIHVASKNNRFMGRENESDALEYLFQISKRYHADMSVMKNDDIVGTIALFAKKHRVTRAVLGVSVLGAGPDMTDEMKKRMPGLEFHVIPYDATSAAGM
jgi:K+-sensing histidine kinase KdpD